jgi:FKBP-type peptidyl-prolyl cis-trans isomerase SlyD
MKIEDNHVVRFHYTVSESGGDKLESSRESEPLSILVGHGNIIPGLEEAFRGREAGESFNVSVGPEQGYGLRRDGMVQRVPRKHFKGAKLVPGQQVVLPTPQGQRAMTIQKVGMSVVDVDLNHPMAGKTLDFDVEILEVRPATESEIEHRHAHAGDGHVH